MDFYEDSKITPIFLNFFSEAFDFYLTGLDPKVSIIINAVSSIAL